MPLAVIAPGQSQGIQPTMTRPGPHSWPCAQEVG
jgi:hypothetical protein